MLIVEEKAQIKLDQEIMPGQQWRLMRRMSSEIFKNLVGFSGPYADC